MTTSGSTDFTLTRNDIITDAFQQIGIGMEGESITAFMSETASRTLNMMIKTWETKGARLWSLADKSLGLAVGKVSYSLSPRPLEIMNVRISDGTNETPIFSLSRQEYFDLPNKTVRATPVNYYYDPQRTTGMLYLWPAPDDATRTIKYNYRRTLEDMDGNADEPDFPQEWIETITANLAVRLARKYGRPLNPDLKIDAQQLEFDLLAWGQENESVYLGIDYT